MLNRVILIGRLTRDPELKYTPQGQPVATMGLAVNRFTKDENNNYEVDFFNIVAWRRTAEFANNYLTKGRLVSVDGRIQTRSYVAADGTKRNVFEIVAENLEGLDRKGDGEGGSYAGGEHATADAPPSAASSAPSAPAPRATSAAPAAAPARRQAAPRPPVDDDLDEADPFADE